LAPSTRRVTAKSYSEWLRFGDKCIDKAQLPLDAAARLSRRRPTPALPVVIAGRGAHAVWWSVSVLAIDRADVFL